MTVDALQAKALMTAYVDPDKASDALKAYLDVLVPTSPEEEGRTMRAKERLLESVSKLDPIKLSDISLGTPIGGNPGGGSMFR